MWDVEAPTFSLDNRLKDGGEVVSLTCPPPFTPRKIPGTHYCQRLSRPQGHSATGKITSIEKSNDLIGNRTRYLPACSIQPHGLIIILFHSLSFVSFYFSFCSFSSCISSSPLSRSSIFIFTFISFSLCSSSSSVLSFLSSSPYSSVSWPALLWCQVLKGWISSYFCINKSLIC
jgi:hypothetical protein